MISIEDLVGSHVLSGVERGYTEYDNENVEFLSFTLDGVNYMAVEDPEDGWRSSLREIIITEKTPKIKLPNVKVVCFMEPGEHKNILCFQDSQNCEVFMSVGTNYYDEWYPVCVLEYDPRKLYVNQVNMINFNGNN